MRKRKWPVRARKNELIAIILGEIRKRTKLADAAMPNLDKLPTEEVTLLAMAFGYRDPEARADQERRAQWAREQRERDEAKRLPAPPLRLAAPKEGAA